VLKERQSILVGLAKVCATLAPIMQFYFCRIDRKSNGHKMVKGTCFVALKRKDRSARILDLKSLHILDLVVFIRRLQNKFS
jgi:hypothetical protein